MIFKDDVVLAVDPSINTAGYAVFSKTKEPRVKNEFKWHLKSFGCLRSSGETTYSRILVISRYILQLTVNLNITHAMVEIPPEIVYLDDIVNRAMNRERKKQAIIARASRVMKLFSSGYYYMSALGSKLGTKKVRTVLPVQWQAHKSKRGGRDTKEWSIDHANAFLKSEGFKSILRSGHGENTADAINIGFFILNSGKSGGFDSFG